MVDPRFIFPRTEFIPNENVNYTFQVRSQSGRPFDYIDNYTVISDHPCIVNDSENILTSTGKGFATITCQITDYEQTTLICVYEPLSVTKIITVDNVEEETPCIDRQDGPLQWPNSKKPKATITCGNAKVELIDDTFLRLRSSYNGMCKLSVTNEKTVANPMPRPDSFEFQVRAIKIDSIAIAVIDRDSKNDPESGLAKSTVDAISIVTQRMIQKVDSLNQQLMQLVRSLNYKVRMSQFQQFISQNSRSLLTQKVTNSLVNTLIQSNSFKLVTESSTRHLRFHYLMK
ncbi:hypothetical protein TVAG_358790 [Trichomonas vaginalis G3]|uniref:Uncharacterized protein n=1 Tax=Trichomonas vaginalis (strain ATCC PRA-98 / G3) TaxID=412133 RepID=A2E882_TRIV3|nr:nuclear pore membrane glycoprotein GP210-related family [Trichomonas vaginalis G3]EAY11100.1 hypothetical protein TVAG_358790 [Trichomonas vaginalis G3]KAI5492619.1 nuclear pore membrane glycoprotein GP210-related family [Trichomonas vaginalis G3]|eukprot:XP_001323323.1 hypothetical protein [Trichomonas vaginalis G3]